MAVVNIDSSFKSLKKLTTKEYLVLSSKILQSYLGFGGVRNPPKSRASGGRFWGGGALTLTDTVDG